MMIKFNSLSLANHLLIQDVKKSDAEENRGQNNCGFEEKFFKAHFGAIDIALAAESGAQTGAAILQ